MNHISCRLPLLNRFAINMELPVQTRYVIIIFRSCQFQRTLMFMASARCMGEEHMLELIISHLSAHSDLRQPVQQSPLLPFTWTCSSTGWTCGPSPSDNSVEMCSFKRMIIDNARLNVCLFCSPWPQRDRGICNTALLFVLICMSLCPDLKLRNYSTFPDSQPYWHKITGKPV